MYKQQLNTEIQDLEKEYLINPTLDNFRKLHEKYKVLELYYILELNV